jgi:hypothetical protein
MKISIERLRQLIKEEVENVTELPAEETVELVAEEEGSEKQVGAVRSIEALLPRIQNRKIYEALLKLVLTYNNENIDKAMALKNVVGPTASSSILQLLGDEPDQTTPGAPEDTTAVETPVPEETTEV